jgi:nucleoside-diphosphate-sugar epimerase
MTILITGASGFVGQRLCALLAGQSNAIRGVARSATAQVLGLGEMGATTDWSQVLPGCTQVVHLAARVHVMQDASSSPLQEYRKVNVEGTLALARQAAAVGVKRFVFISSVKVNGEFSTPGRPFHADDLPAPQDPYGVSKMEAEAGLRALAGQTGMEVVVIRPPLVYGPGVKANFAAMVRWLQRGVPLPLGAIHNQRSLVALDNLVHLITICLKHPGAANQTFMVSDGEDVSTSELLWRIGMVLGKPARLLPVPQRMLEWGAVVLGKQDMAQRLLSSLQVDTDATRQILGWVPPVSLEQGLLQVVQSIRNP